MSIFLLCAFIFFASFLEESFTAHMMFYGVMLTFIFNSAGHWRRPEATDKSARIVILGGGFSAIRAAMKLEKLRGSYSNVKVTLVSPSSEFLFGPMLPEGVGGSVQPANIVNPIRRILPTTQVIEGRVEQLDEGTSSLRVKRPDGGHMTLGYDELILAQQSEPDFNDVSGLAQHGHPIDGIGDALYLRQWVLKKLAQAEHFAPGDDRKGLLGFAVLGDGERACGTAMEISRLLHAARSAYPAVDYDEIRVRLFKVASEHDPDSLTRLRDRLLRRHGVELLDARVIASVTATAIHLENGTALPCATTVNARYQLPENLLHAGAHQWQPSDDKLALRGRKNIWLASDDNSRLQAHRPGHYELYRLGEQAAYNAWADSQGFPLYDYRPPRKWVETFHMGRYSVARLGPLVFGGLPAWLLSRASCLNALPGLERNLRMVIDWILDIPFRNDIAVLTPDRTERLSQAYFHAGDVLMREGERGDSAYIIQSGSLSIFVNGEKIEQRGRGDIMGELALINNAPRTATVICDTDVAVTCLNRGQFMELMGGLSVFGEAIRKRTRIYEDTPAIDNAEV